MVGIGLFLSYISAIAYTRAFVAIYEAAAWLGPCRKKVDLMAMHRARRSVRPPPCSPPLLGLVGWPSPRVGRGPARRQRLDQQRLQRPRSPRAATCPAGNLLAGKRPVHWTRHPRRLDQPAHRRRGGQRGRGLGRPAGDGARDRRLGADLGPRPGGPGAGPVGAGRRQRRLHGLGLGRRRHATRTWAGSNRPRGCTACAAARCRWAGCPSASCASARGRATASTRCPRCRPSASCPAAFPLPGAGGARGGRGRSPRTSAPTGTTRPRRLGAGAGAAGPGPAGLGRCS